MPNGSPPAYLLWAILATIFQGYLVLHLWTYDKFQCIRWSSGRQPGAFRRVMVYSYFMSLPLLLVFGVSMTTLKYQEGYILIPGDKVVPRPYHMWKDSTRDWITPLYFVLSVAWGFEIITHLEELCFWLFLLNQGPSKRNWFKSWEFRTWYGGSIIAILGLPITPLIRRHNLETCLPWILTAGSSAGAVTTLAFSYVLARFPTFIRHVKKEGATPDVISRLVNFYHLNLLRYLFRIAFNMPFLVLGLDGIQGDHDINLDPFWSDFLFMVGAIGCFLSSAITLLVFFPLSWKQESAQAMPIDEAGQATPPDYHHHHHDQAPGTPMIMSPSASIHQDSTYRGSELNSSFRFPSGHERSLTSVNRRHSDMDATPEYETDPELSPQSQTKALPSEHPRPTSVDPPEIENHEYKDQPPKGGALGHELSVMHSWPDDETPRPYDSQGFAAHQQRPLRRKEKIPSSSSRVHPYIMNFTSPIDLLDDTEEPSGSRNV